MSSFQLAIIGGGPRALTILERLLEHKERMPRNAMLNVLVIDPGNLGEGSHPTDQANHLLINTLASQVTMYPPRIAGEADTGTSLLDWAAAQGYRRFADEYRIAREPQEESLSEHLPRLLLGRFLAAFGREVISALPGNIRVQHVRARATDIRYEGGDYAIELDNEQTLLASHVILAMGHGHRAPTADDRRLATFAQAGRAANPHLAYYASPYPISELDTIADGKRVAIQGLGLTAHDVVSALTIGRGGVYREDHGKMVYRPSGREPRLWLCSRHTLPFAARGINQKGRTGRHICQFFTRQAVKHVAGKRHAQIDFESQLLPLVIKEMAYAYRVAEGGEPIDARGFEPTPEEVRLIRRILWPLEDLKFRSSTEFRNWFLARIKEDLQEAYRGNCTSGVKAATDVLRDAREGFREAVEFGGLTPASHRYFLEQFNPIINRVSFGPPLRRNEEWIALFEAGILDVAGGPVTRIETPEDDCVFHVASDCSGYIGVDAVISARLDNYSPLTDCAPLSAKLLRRGLVRPFMNGEYHPSGIDIDANLRVKDAGGTVQRRLWAVGFVVEGPHFYTHALPRPGIASRQTADAEHIALALYDDIVANAPMRLGVTTDPQQEVA
ncbi:FAD/NAD(P)-binding protein [uncultured Bradyrhizobium sp.]|uniref:FAD/NAD(P)-binding protein n=1 Tax=uncultured Bradyrhizobium sp. TaxID=199684 RepID=UPI0035CAB026